jgi:AcrR family transcriptional regulator
MVRGFTPSFPGRTDHWVQATEVVHGLILGVDGETEFQAEEVVFVGRGGPIDQVRRAGSRAYFAPLRDQTEGGRGSMNNERPSRPPRGRKRKGEGLQRRAEILDAAKQLFVEEGYAATTIRRIAAKLGVSSTALYVYFPDKDAILVEICDNTFAGLIEELDRVRRDCSDPLGALTKCLEQYIRFGLDHSNEYELTFVTRRAKELQKLKSENENLGMQAFGRFYDCVDGVVRAGLTSHSDTRRLTQQLWAAIHGLVVLLLLRSEFPWVEVDALIRGHVTMLVCGVTKQGR